MPKSCSYLKAMLQERPRFSMPSSLVGGPFSRRSFALEKSYLGSEDSRLNQLERLAVDPNQALAGLALSDSLFITPIQSAKQNCSRPRRRAGSSLSRL